MSEKTQKAKKDESIEATANSIWAAGMAALQTAEKEGSKIFKYLVEKGTDFQDKHKEISQKQIEKLSKIVTGGVGSVRGKIEDITSQQEHLWEKIRLDEAVYAVVKTFGVATSKDIDTIAKKIDSLSKTVKELQATTKIEAVKKAAVSELKSPAPKKQAAARKATSAPVAVPTTASAKAPAQKKPTATRKATSAKAVAPAPKKPVETQKAESAPVAAPAPEPVLVPAAPVQATAPAMPSPVEALQE